MNWGFPLSFLLLLGVLPLIVFLHSLRPRGLKVSTTTLFLWERLLRERTVGSRLGRLLKKNLPLVLQLLSALVLITALADPSLLSWGAPGGNTVAVVDLSASMKAKGRSGSRFDDARRELFSLIDAVPAGQKMMVVGAAAAPRLLSPFTEDKKKLRDLARALQPTDGAAEVKEAILFAHSFLKRSGRDRVVVISDGAFDGAEELPWNSPHLRLVRAEGPSDNVGIINFEFRRAPGLPGRYEAMLSVRNFTSRPVSVPVTLTVGEKRLVQENVEIAPQQSRVLIHPYEGTLSGRATAVLGIEDDFPTDNQAYLALSESRPMSVLYAGKGNPFLEHLFRSLGARVSRLERLDPDSLSSALQAHDVIVLDGIPSPPLVEGNFLLINTVGAGLPLSAGGKIFRPRPLPQLARHPVTAGIRLDDLYIREALRLLPAGAGIPLAVSREGPLIVALEKDRLRALAIGFDLAASDLPFKVAFPVLLSNAFDWFQPKRPEFPATGVPAGKPYLLHLRGTDEEVELRSPSGRRDKLRALSNPLSFADTFDAGFYTFKSGSREGEFAANLFSESESRIAPRVREGSSENSAAGGREEAERGFSLWPYLLLLVAALLAVEAYLVFRRGLSLYPLALRSLALTALMIAVINPKIFRAIDALDVIVGADFSRSVGQEGKDQAVEVLEQARRIKTAATRAGLFFFGRQPAWEFFPRADLPLADFSPAVARQDTDLQAALQAALAQIGEGREGRILLISDGNENRGELSRVLPLIRSQGVPVWVLPVSLTQGKNEIYLSDLVLPQQVDSAETFEVRGSIEALRDAPARVKLLRDGVIRREEAVALKAGTHWVRFRESLRERGSQRVLALQGYSVVESAAEERALSLPELSSFDLLVLDDVPAHRLSPAKMEAIEKYVRDLGGGLIVVGGTQSYGAGGYYKTPLERLLPVDMRPPARLDLPQVALLFVLDKSGSMGAGPPGATKLDLAKAAAFAAADLLNPSDQVGILAFDAGWDWALPFRQVGKGELISERLSSLQSDGGTDLHKAMVEARRALSAKAAAVKHLLILSDGLTDKADFRSLVTKMARDGITVSTVALGQDADIVLLTEIARDGKGRSYMTADPKAIPQIFTTETLLISRDLLVEKLTHPAVTAGTGPLKGFGQKKIPPLRGYVLTHRKPAAELLMKAGEDPLLASWSYGLGRVVAFTSDLTGRWGKEWLQW
ncbi:MAG: VWA domain-containing protein, partial [Deltaproteobacteria bacterium]|nr:VWA domain-containing protein [Deltaproteobacteria bacterium]